MNKSLFGIRFSPQNLKIYFLSKARFSLYNRGKEKIKFNKKNLSPTRFKQQNFRIDHHNNNTKNLIKEMSRLNNLNRGNRDKFLVNLFYKIFNN